MLVLFTFAGLLFTDTIEFDWDTRLSLLFCLFIAGGLSAFGSLALRPGADSLTRVLRWLVFGGMVLGVAIGGIVGFDVAPFHVFGRCLAAVMGLILGGGPGVLLAKLLGRSDALTNVEPSLGDVRTRSEPSSDAAPASMDPLSAALFLHKSVFVRATSWAILFALIGAVLGPLVWFFVGMQVGELTIDWYWFSAAGATIGILLGIVVMVWIEVAATTAGRERVERKGRLARVKSDEILRLCKEIGFSPPTSPEDGNVPGRRFARRPEIRMAVLDSGEPIALPEPLSEASKSFFVCLTKFRNKQLIVGTPGRGYAFMPDGRVLEVEA